MTDRPDSDHDGPEQYANTPEGDSALAPVSRRETLASAFAISGLDIFGTGGARGNSVLSDVRPPAEKGQDFDGSAVDEDPAVGFDDDFDYATDQLDENGWTIHDGTFEIRDSELLGDAGGDPNFVRIYRDQPRAAGTFEIRGIQNQAEFYGLRIAFISNATTPRGNTSGYQIIFRQTRRGTVAFGKIDGETVDYFTVAEDHGGEKHDVRIERDPETLEFTVFYDGEEKLTVSDETITESTYWAIGYDGDLGTQRIDAVSFGGSGRIIDDFEDRDRDLSEYTGDSKDQFTVREDPDLALSGSNVLFGTNATPYDAHGIASLPGEGLNAYPSKGDTFSCYVYHKEGNVNSGVFFGVQDTEFVEGEGSGSTPDSAYMVDYDIEENQYNLRVEEDNSVEILDTFSESDGAIYEQWLEYEVAWGETITFTVYEVDSSRNRVRTVGSASAADETFSEGGVGFFVNDSGPEGTNVEICFDYAHIGSSGDTSSFEVVSEDSALLSSLTSDVRFEIRNESDRRFVGIDVSASARSDAVTVTRVDAVGNTDFEPGEEALVQLTVDNTFEPTERTEVEIDLEIVTTETGAVFTETITVPVLPPVTLSVDTPPGVSTVEVGTEVPVEFTLSTNALKELSDVEVRPDLSSLPGDWSVGTPGDDDGVLPIDTSRRPDGGEWTPPGRAPVWRIDELAPGEIQQPGLTLSVPEDAPTGPVELPVTIQAASSGEPETLTGFDTDPLELTRTLFTFGSDTPEEGFKPGERSPLGVELVAQEPISDPSLTVGPLPDGVDTFPSDGDVSDDGTVDGVGSFVEFSWSGEFEPGDRVTGTVPILPRPGNVGVFEVPLSGVVTDRTDGEERTRDRTTTLSVTLFEPLLEEKPSVADTVRDLSVPPGIEDQERVQDELLPALSEAVDEGRLSSDVAGKVLERLILGERIAIDTLDYARQGTDTVDADETRLARRMAGSLVSVVTTLVFPPSLVIKRVAGIVGARWAISAGRSFLRWADSVVTPILRNPGQEVTESVVDTLIDGGITTVAGLAGGMGDTLAGLTDAVESELLRQVVQYELGFGGLSQSLTALNDEANAIATGGASLSGTNGQARRTFQAAKDNLEGKYTQVATLLDDLGQPWYADLLQGVGLTDETSFFEKAYDLGTASDVVGVVARVGQFFFQLGDAILSFIGPFLPLFSSLQGLNDLTNIGMASIEGVRQGTYVASPLGD